MQLRQTVDARRSVQVRSGWNMQKKQNRQVYAVPLQQFGSIESASQSLCAICRRLHPFQKSLGGVLEVSITARAEARAKGCKTGWICSVARLEVWWCPCGLTPSRPHPHDLPTPRPRGLATPRTSDLKVPQFSRPRPDPVWCRLSAYIHSSIHSIVP